MKSNRTMANRMIATAAILACILFSVSAIAAELSVNEQLLQAAQKGSLEHVKALLEKGGDVNARNKKGDTVLMAAAWGKHLEIVKLFVDKGADVNAKTKQGHTALMNAAEGGNLEVRAYLIDKGADVNAKAVFGRTVLKSASWFRDQPEVVEYLKAHGAK